MFVDIHSGHSPSTCIDELLRRGVADMFHCEESRRLSPLSILGVSCRAGIVGAYYPDDLEANGVAPGVQIVSLKVWMDGCLYIRTAVAFGVEPGIVSREAGRPSHGSGAGLVATLVGIGLRYRSYNQNFLAGRLRGFRLHLSQKSMCVRACVRERAFPVTWVPCAWNG